MKVLYAAAALAPLMFGLTDAQAGDWRSSASNQAPHYAWDRGADASAGRRLYQSGSECGPDQATPVWGHDNALLGYACESASANGS